MTLIALIKNAISKLGKLVPDHSAVHLCAATVSLAKTAIFIIASPESLLDGSGRDLLQSNNVASNIKAIFIDKFHVIKSW
jgi:hypothetical protein